MFLNFYKKTYKVFFTSMTPRVTFSNWRLNEGGRKNLRFSNGKLAISWKQ